MKKGVQEKEFAGSILILLTALISGISIVVNKFFVVKIDPVIFTAVRAFFIGLVFFIISLFACNFKIKRFKRVSWWYLLLIGVIGGGLAFLLFFTGLKETTAGRAAFLHKTLPLYATILAFFFLREKITKKQIAAMILMLLGLGLVEAGNIKLDVRFGDALVLGATILWAVENTIAKKVMLKRESNWVVTFSRMFFGSILLFGIIALTGKIDALISLGYKQIIYIIVSASLLFLYVLFWYWGLKFINLSKASTILLIAPFISLMLGYFWLNEMVSNFQIIGSILILIGAYIIIRIKSEHNIEEI